MAVRRMTPLGQRLIAAGAQPERAQQFVEQTMFERGAPVGMPATTGKPQGPNEWYNEDYAAASASLYDKGFRAPKFGDPLFPQYYDFVFGKGSYKKIDEKGGFTFATSPNYLAAKSSKDQFDIAAIKAVESGATLPSVLQKFEQSYATDKTITGAMTKEDAIKYITNIWTEYNKGRDKTDLETVFAKQINRNKDFRFGMPDPKLRYGTATNLNAGTVDILTNPTANRLYTDYASKNPNASPSQLNQYKAGLVAEAAKRGLTPWRDEARRRDALKGKKIGG